MADIGRISGPLLKDNLVRNGVDLAFETDLLYLNVNDFKIGVGTDAPARELEIPESVKTTRLIVDDLITVTSNIEIDNANTISTVLGSIYLDSQQSINVNGVATDNLRINNNIINSLLDNSDLFLTPTRKLQIDGNVKILANLHVTGDVTFDGDIVFGNSDQDNVTFQSDVAGDLMPNITERFKLGNSSKHWNGIYSKTLLTTNVTAGTITTSSNIDFGLKFTNAYFVSTTGSDTNQGDHQNSPFRSLEHALSQATAGDTIYIYSGTYYETFPLTVPAGVSIVGFDVRATIIEPTSGTESNDAFLLNGETTISDLCVKNFFYDAVNNTGYAFRFADGFKVTTRSPYLQNITVITHGYTAGSSYDGEYANNIVDLILDGGGASVSFDQILPSEGAILSYVDTVDPLGFADGNAGKGCLIDGSVAHPDSKFASLLFHSCTFITPGVDCITMTNGVRVEWLNSFTYFANRGLYATNGSLGFASQALLFGAEIRSIGSANVYGNYGAVADGNQTLMYLINHNFGYVGCANDISNDATLVIQANETVEFNDGKIYYTSQSQNGDFRVGDQFLVDFLHGNVTFDTAGMAANGLTSITIQGNNSLTFIEANKLLTGNFRLAGNTIETLSGNFNILSASTATNFDLNVRVAKNLSITGNLSTDGTLTFGNQTSDTLTFNTNFTQDIIPNADKAYDLGTSSKVWRNAYLTELRYPEVTIKNSQIQTTSTNGNLTFYGNGTGGVKLESLFLNQNTITSYSNSSIKLTPNTGKGVSISGTSAVKIPRNTFVLTTKGTLHYNTADNYYEGYSSARVTLGGVYSANRLTSVTAHPTNNIISFKVNNNTVATVDSTALHLNGLQSSTLSVNNNVFTSTGNLSIVGNVIKVQNFDFDTSDITTSVDENLELRSTGSGYVHFTNKNAIGLPIGPDAERPTSPLLGNTRFNNERNYMEVWNGSEWAPVSGTGEVATFEYANEQTTLWSLILT